MIWKTDTIQLNAFGGVTYNWTPDYNMDCPTCQTPQVWPDTNTTYYLTIADGRGCYDYDSVVVLVRNKPFTMFFIPNAITPNGDGYNDRWYIRDLERYPDNEVRIINRWGDEVFYQKPYDNNWQGTWKGENLPGATYYYIIKIKFNGESYDFNGPLTVVR
jgi:gliding motility-associated-like protein